MTEEIDKRLERMESAIFNTMNRLSSVEKLLVESNKEQKDLMSLKEACEWFGMAEQTMYRRIKERSIPFLKDKRKVFFSKKQLIESLTVNKTV